MEGDGAMGVHQTQRRLQVQERSQRSLEAVQQAVRSALDEHRMTLRQVDLDDFVDDLLSEDSDDFLTRFVQSSGE
jgi:hypothetical protein